MSSSVERTAGVVLVHEGGATRTALLEPRLSSDWFDAPTAIHATSRPLAADAVIRRWFMFVDGGEHRLLRRTVTPPFAPAALVELGPALRSDLRSLLARVARSRIEVRTELTDPFAALSVCRVTGIDGHHAPQFRGWIDDLSAYLVRDYLSSVVERGRRAVAELSAAAEQAIDSRSPSGAAACLRGAVDRGETDLSVATATLTLLVYAGFATTTILLDNLAFELAGGADGRKLEGDENVGAFVEEVLRRNLPVPQVARRATTELSVEEATLHPDELVLLRLGDGDPRSALPFGHGPHYCLGARLAMIQGELFAAELKRELRALRVLEASASAGKPRTFTTLTVCSAFSDDVTVP